MKTKCYSVIKVKKMIGFFLIETPKSIWIDELVCLRSKMYSFLCRDDSKNKLKGISKSQSKHIECEEYKKCLDGEEYQNECNKYILRSINHEKYLQEVKKTTLFLFDGKRCYLNTTKSIPWNWSYFNRLNLSDFYWKRFFSTNLLPTNAWKRIMCCKRI